MPLFENLVDIYLASFFDQLIQKFHKCVQVVVVAHLAQVFVCCLVIKFLLTFQFQLLI